MAKRNTPKTNGATAGIGDNSESLRQEIRDTFEDVYKVNEQIAAAIEKSVAPLRKIRVKFYRTLKANTGINRKTIDAEYAFFVIAKQALELEDEDHRDKVLDDLGEIHAALHPNAKQLNWLDAIELTSSGAKPKRKARRRAKPAAKPADQPAEPTADTPAE